MNQNLTNPKTTYCEILLELEPEDLAGIILEYFNSQSTKKRGLAARGNLISSEALRDYPHEYETDIRYALVEEDPTQRSKDLYCHRKTGPLSNIRL